MWNNLIANALKFTPDGGKLTISSAVTDGVVSVSIKDSGIGMTAEQMRHIFNKFYQADTSHATKGNGLGLALVKKICDLLGCTVSVLSHPNEGSEFTVRIPLTQS